jgi:hypothetical protein
VTTRGRVLINRVNGVRIDKLEDLINAFESGTNAYDTVEFVPHHGIECLDHADVVKANGGILKTYGIAKDRRL